ncbi:hypothetical protein QFZ52_002528 [Arthrobacter woluwensis]|nr:hypothetical protein [Arthrobacter woluwensis]
MMVGVAVEVAVGVVLGTATQFWWSPPSLLSRC